MNETYGPNDLTSTARPLTSTHSKRKLGHIDDGEHFYSFDIEHEQSTKSFCCHSPALTINSNSNTNNTLTNYQQTTKIIQEFNIQQSTTSDITVSSTINIKSTPKQQQQQQMKLSNSDLLSEADFQRVVQDITPADRDLFDEFLNGIKQKTDDYLFLSSFDDLPLSSQEQESTPKQSSPVALPSQTSTQITTDRRRNSIARGSSTIHYGPHATPIINRPPTAAAQTLKQMAVQHQQRVMYNQQQQLTSSYSNYSYNNSTRQYYTQSQSSSENDPHTNPNAYYQQQTYVPTQQVTMSSYNHNAQQHSNIYGIQNYAYQTSTPSSFYQPTQPPIATSSYSIVNYSPSNGLPSTTITHPSSSSSSSSSSSTFYSQEDNLPILDL